MAGVLKIIHPWKAKPGQLLLAAVDLANKENANDVEPQGNQSDERETSAVSKRGSFIKGTRGTRQHHDARYDHDEGKDDR